MSAAETNWTEPRQLVSLLPAGHAHCLEYLPDEAKDVEILYVPSSCWQGDLPSVTRRTSQTWDGEAGKVGPNKAKKAQLLVPRAIILPAGFLRSAWDVLSPCLRM